MENKEAKKEITFKVTGTWADQAKTLKTKYSQLTDADLKCEPGKEAELITRMESKLNKKHEEVVAILNTTTTPKA